MNVLKKILKWILILVLVFVGAVLLINAFDEDLRPEVAAFAEYPKPRFEDKENAYFALMGFLR